MKWIILLAVLVYVGMNVKVKTTHSPKAVDKVVSEVGEKIVSDLGDTFSEINKNAREQVNLSKYMERK